MAKNLSKDISSSGSFSLLLTGVFESFVPLLDSDNFELADFLHLLKALWGDSDLTLGLFLLDFQISDTSTSLSPVCNKGDFYATIQNFNTNGQWTE